MSQILNPFLCRLFHCPENWQGNKRQGNHFQAIVKRLFLFLFVSSTAFAAEPKIIELWLEGVPNLNTNLSGEKILDHRIVNVQKPSLLGFNEWFNQAN